MAVRHFLTLQDLTPAELRQVLDRAVEFKQEHHLRQYKDLFRNRVLGMIFEKSSTRTRVSFEAGMAQMGGNAMFLAPKDIQLGRGEPIEDSARVMSAMVDIIMIRTFGHNRVERFAQFSSVPIINALTDDFHPCQLLADMQTFIEHRGSIQGKTVAWIGDGNNMCQTYIQAAKQFDFELRIACPQGFEPREDLLDANKDRVAIMRDPKEAARGAHLLATDVWASMGHEHEINERRRAFAGYQLNRELLGVAASDALYMHCLPAHREEEISADLMEDPHSVIWDEAENRLHSQKALIEFLLNHTEPR
ncbi:MAG: ornithine carbamoyltransferase [Spongiibacteraceae bacterium]